MEENEIKALAGTIGGTIEETHISWVILTKAYAFKIKKPVKFSFLDFSTLGLRKRNCKKELQLNSRFTDIYLAVVPVRRPNNRWAIAGKEGEIMDYAVQMKRMAGATRMDNLLANKAVNAGDIRSLAKLVAFFHQKAEKITTPFDLQRARDTFNDIASVGEFVSETLGKNCRRTISSSIAWSNAFLKKHAKRFGERIKEGFKRDVHGDFHSGNVFLTSQPVLFDCIEFNDHYRQIDVVDEIAFLCMDLEAFGQKELSETFLSEYRRYFDAFRQKADEAIFRYYKCLRANIRAKVHALRAFQGDEKARERHLPELEKYLLQVGAYLAQADM